MTEPAPAWWQSFVDGELAGFGHLIETYQRHVFAVALATVVDRSLAEDVVQETFIAAHAHRADVRDPAAVGRWLASIARNQARDMIRAHRRESLTDIGELELATSDDCSPHHDIESAALRNQLSMALARVPESLREVLVLYYAHDHSAEHVARELGLSEAATMQRLSRGRKLMRQYAAALEDYVRPRRALAAAVMALLAVRVGSAHAAPTRARPPIKALVFGASGVALVFGWTLVDHASARSVDAATTIEPIVAAAEPEPVSMPAHSIAMPSHAATRVPYRRDSATRHDSLAATPDTDTTIRVDAAVPHGKADTRVGVAAEISVTGSVPPAPIESLCPCSTVAARRWDPVNGFVESAAMPRAGEVMFEMIGLDWITRVGLSEHVAAHVAFTPIETRVGDNRNANPAFGGGVKIGGALDDQFSVAVVGEAAHEVRLNTMSVGEAWIGRTYASLTRGSARDNATVSAGVVAYDNRSERWVSPVLSLGSQIGWDDRLAFVTEVQWFPRPLATLSTTTVLAVRFRHQDRTAPLLGIDRTRIDLGTVIINTTDDDVEMAPWLQVGLGW